MINKHVVHCKVEEHDCDDGDCDLEDYNEDLDEFIKSDDTSEYLFTPDNNQLQPITIMKYQLCEFSITQTQ